LSVCAGGQLDSCKTCTGRTTGCCLLTTPAGCFDPDNGGIAYTRCNTDHSQACTMPTALELDVTLTNSTGADAEVYVTFLPGSAITGWDFCVANSGGEPGCHFTLPANGSKALPNDGKQHLNFNASFGAQALQCPAPGGGTLVEANVYDPGNFSATDISLVNGYNANVQIVVTSGGWTQTLGPVPSATGNQNAFGVYPLGCDVCVARCQPGCERLTPPDRPVPCSDVMGCQRCTHGNAECKAGDQSNPAVPCHYVFPPVGSFTIEMELLSMD